MELVLEYSLDNLTETVDQILPYTQDCNLMLFVGEIGAGKTTLIKTLCKKLGVNEIVSSPTYSIVNEYLIAPNKKLYHFDLFRLKNEAEAEDIGFGEYLDSNYPCIIEWPEMAPSFLKERKALQFRLEHLNENQRRLTLSTIN